MNPMWVKQTLAVLRLEIRKTFFARRGLWIYLLAALPVLIFGAHAWDKKRDYARRAGAAQPGVTAEKMAKIEPEMKREEVEAILGKPYGVMQWRRRNGEIEVFQYTDGKAELQVRMRDGEVERVSLRGGCDFSEDLHIFAGVFQFMYLRLVVFFGCVFVFLNLFRGEMLDKSLHYYFLAPVRREVVVAGKFLAGLVATVVVFGLSTLLQLGALYGHFDAASLDPYLATGGGWGHAAAYVGVTALACLGYGSVFLAGGMLVRNPLIPAAVILLWESINGLLPSVLRKVSVIYYLKSLCPVEVPVDRNVPPPLAMLALNVDGARPVVAILGLLVVAAALLMLAGWKSRGLEIRYGTE